MDLGGDVIVGQGTESGGHGARRGRSTLPFVPIVVDLAAPTPALAAGAEDALARIRLADGAPADRGPADPATGR